MWPISIRRLPELGKGNNIPGGNPFDPLPFTGDIALFNYYEGILLSAEQVETLYRAQAGDAGSFQITDFEITSPQSVNLTWDSVPGRFYNVEVSPDLSSGSWQPVMSAIPADPDPAIATSSTVEGKDWCLTVLTVVRPLCSIFIV